MDEPELISPCPTTPELSPEPGFVIEVPPFISPTGTNEQGICQSETTFILLKKKNGRGLYN